MWITLPLAALATVLLAVRGRPWHGLVAGTLGLYLFDAVWSLMARGTGGFMGTTTSPDWWQPTLGFGVAAVATGVPAIRRRLFGRGSWRRAKGQVSDEIRARATSTPDWQRALLDASLDGRPDAWDAAASTIVQAARPGQPARVQGDTSSAEHRVSGPLGQAIVALDRCLDSVDASAAGEARCLSAAAWTRLLDLGGTGEAELGLTHSDRAELVLRAASQADDAGLALGWRWFNGVEDVVERLGTNEQKQTLLPHLGQNGEIVAAGWSGCQAVPATAIVVREDRGAESVLGLRIQYDLQGVVGVHGATLIALMVATSDPDGHLSECRPASRSEGSTCVLIRPNGGLSVLNGVGAAERLSSQPLIGATGGEDVFVGLDQVVGGVEGICAVDEVLERLLDGLEAVRVTAMLAGRAQRVAALQGSKAILENVMNGGTIEAWGHADLGATVLRMTALSRTAARVLDDRPLERSEARNFSSAARRLMTDWVGAQEDAGLAPDGAAEAATFLASLPSGALVPTGPLVPTGAEAASAGWIPGWIPGWHQAELEAVLADSRAAFDGSRARGLREWVATTARGACSALLAWVPGRGAAADTDLNATFAGIARAHAVVHAAALRIRPSHDAQARLIGHLGHADERLTVCISLALVDRFGGSQPVERPLLQFAILDELAAAHTELSAAVGCLGGTLARLSSAIALRAAWGSSRGPTPEMAESVAAAMVANPEVLRRLTAGSYQGHAENGGTGPLRQASRLAAASRVPIAAIQRAQALGQLPDDEFSSVLDLAVARRIASSSDVAKIRACMAVASEFLSSSAPAGTTSSERKTA